MKRFLSLTALDFSLFERLMRQAKARRCRFTTKIVRQLSLAIHRYLSPTTTSIKSSKFKYCLAVARISSALRV